MKNFNLIRNTFVRQLHESDCGTACLAMILNYIGSPEDAALVSAETFPSGSGLSLLDLQKLGIKYGLKCRPVRMDVVTLRSLIQPIILHVVNSTGANHFIVCFGARKDHSVHHYVIGDPAGQMILITEQELDVLWQSKAALYFEDISFHRPPLKEQPWVLLFFIRSFPLALWIAIPFLNICTTVLGIALSWTLQRGIQDSLTGKKSSLIIAVLLLLLIITLFKSMVSYVKQHVLIKLNNAVNEQFINAFIKRVIHGKVQDNPRMNEQAVKSRMVDIQKVQNAVSNFAAVMLSEGSLIILAVSAMSCMESVVALINTVYVLILSSLALRNAPMLSYQTAYLNDLSINNENALLREFRNKYSLESAAARLNVLQENNNKYLSQARLIATRISRFNLLYESIGAVSVLSVFAVCLVKTDRMLMSYDTLVALVVTSYFITVLMPRICNALVVVAEGAEASRLFNAEVPPDSL